MEMPCQGLEADKWALCRGNLGPKTYLVFAGWMAACIVITYLYLPETKGRTPAELDAMFEARVPARKFKGTFSSHKSSLLSCMSCRPSRSLTLSLMIDYQCNLSMESYMNEEKIVAEIDHHEPKA